MTRSTTSAALLRGAVALGIAASLAGCSANSGATVVETPEVEWQDGAPTDDNRYVEAVRAADLGAVLASNVHDFSIEQLSSSVSLDVAVMYYQSFEPLQRFIFPGPRPAVVIETVENDAGDGASVIMCRVSDGWKVEEGETRPSVDLSAGTETEYVIVTSATGELIVDSVQPSGRGCDATGAAVGFFTPTPTIPEKISKSDVRPPIGYED